MRILIAEDNQIVRNALSSFLRGSVADLDVCEAASGTQAINLAMQSNPDLVILDHRMPDMSGLATARVISSLRPGVPILLHTAFPTEDLSRESGRYGVSSVVSKIDGRNLLDAIKSIVDPPAREPSSPPQ